MTPLGILRYKGNKIIKQTFKQTRYEDVDQIQNTGSQTCHHQILGSIIGRGFLDKLCDYYLGRYKVIKAV